MISPTRFVSILNIWRCLSPLKIFGIFIFIFFLPVSEKSRPGSYKRWDGLSLYFGECAGGKDSLSFSSCRLSLYFFRYMKIHSERYLTAKGKIQFIAFEVSCLSRYLISKWTKNWDSYLCLRRVYFDIGFSCYRGTDFF